MLFPVPSKILISLGKLGGYTNTKIQRNRLQINLKAINGQLVIMSGKKFPPVKLANLNSVFYNRLME